MRTNPQKKNIGFIKSQSSKRFYTRPPLNQSSQFSSFQMDNGGRTEFSPYKMPQNAKETEYHTKNDYKYKMNYQKKIQNKSNMNSMKDIHKEPYKTCYENNYFKKQDDFKRTIHDQIKEVERVCRDIGEKKGGFIKKEYRSREEQFKEKEVINDDSQQEYAQYKQHKYQNNHHSSSSSQSEQLISQYKKDDFKLSIKEAVKMKQNKKVKMQGGFYERKGGICFDLPVEQFSRPVIRPPLRTIGEPKKKKDTKDDVLRRRQIAKVYDRQARFKLFGFH